MRGCKNQSKKSLMLRPSVIVFLTAFLAATEGQASHPPTATVAATIVSQVNEKVSPILTGKVEKEECGCLAKKQSCPCWTPAILIDKLPNQLTTIPEISTVSKCDCKLEGCKNKCEETEEKWQKPTIVERLLPEVDKCDCKSKKIVPKKCNCPKLKTECGCQTCPCIRIEDPNIVDAEKEMPCDQFRFRALRSGAQVPPRCNKRL